MSSQLTGTSSSQSPFRSSRHDIGRNRNYKDRKTSKELYKRKASGDVEYREEIENFLQQSEYSVILPGKKQVFKRSGKSAVLLNRPLTDIYKDYKKESCNPKCFSTFAKYRPRHVKTRDRTSWVQCLCEKCENLELKLLALNDVFSCVNYSTIRNLVNDTLCSREDDDKHFSLACVCRVCDKCGIEDLEARLKLNVRDNNISYKTWEDRKVKKMSRKVLVVKTVPQLAFVEMLLKDVHSISYHLFLYRWQRDQYASLCKEPLPGMLVLTMDFSENYRCEYQREIQSAHFGYEQVTLHTMLAHFLCPTCGEVCREYITAVSSDLTHDHYCVKKFVEEAVNHLKQERQVEITNLVQWTDGCASQYKCCMSFYDISTCDLAEEVSRNFFGPHHGKTKCDGEGGVIKSALTREVKSCNRVINSPEDVLSYYEAHEKYNIQGLLHDHDHEMKTVMCVNDIPKGQEFEPDTVLGSRDFFCVKKVKAEVICARNLSCFCEACIDSASETVCINSDYVEGFEERVIPKKKRRQKKEKEIKEKETASVDKQIQGQETASVEYDAYSRPCSSQESDVKSTTDERPRDGQDLSPETADCGMVAEEQSLATDDVEITSVERPCLSPKNDVEIIDEERPKGRGKRRANSDRMFVKRKKTTRNGSSFELQKTSVFDVMKKISRNPNANSSNANDSRDKFFKAIQKKLGDCKNYDDFQFEALAAAEEIRKSYPLPEPVKVPNKVMDYASFPLYPSDARSDMCPYKIYGDGNCLYRVGSVFFWGDEEHHVEVRVRVAIELGLFEDAYLSHDFIMQGFEDTTFKDLPAMYCQIAQDAITDEVLTPTVVQRYYR